MTVTAWTTTNAGSGILVPRHFVTTGGAGATGNRDYLLSNWSVTRTGERDSSIGYYKREGLPIPAHNATRLDDHHMAEGCRFVCRDVSKTYAIAGTYCVASPVADAVSTLDYFYTECYNEAYQQMGRRYRAEVSDLLTILGEARETMSDIAKVAKRIANMYERGLKGMTQDVLKSLIPSARRKKGISQHDVLKAMSEYWLEWSFGVSPLVQDVKSLAEAVASKQEETRRFRRVSGSSRRTAKHQSTLTEVWADGWPGFVRLDGGTEYENTYILKLGGTLFKADLGLPGWASRNGVRAQNLIPAFYQLLPYSWLLDYCLNLGDVISAYCEGEIFLHSPWLVIIRDAEARTTFNAVNDSTWTVNSATAGFITHKRFSFSRAPASLGFPSLFFRAPSSLRQAANVLALAFSRTLNHHATDYRTGSLPTLR